MSKQVQNKHCMTITYNLVSNQLYNRPREDGAEFFCPSDRDTEIHRSENGIVIERDVLDYVLRPLGLVL